MEEWLYFKDNWIFFFIVFWIIFYIAILKIGKPEEPLTAAIYKFFSGGFFLLAWMSLIGSALVFWVLVAVIAFLTGNWELIF